MNRMFETLASTDHEQVLYCRDRETGLRAIIAIHDSRPGRAMGATRLYPYASDEAALRDALRLSRGMTHKAAAAGLPVGGAKAVIIGAPRDKRPALLRAYARFVDRLGGRFVTGQDVNLTADDVHVMAGETAHVVGTRDLAGGPVPSTAAGLVKGIQAACKHVLGSRQLSGVTVAVMGVGNVGARLCALLAERGARLIVADLDVGRAEAMAERHGAAVVGVNEIHQARADVFSPCAMGGALGADTIARLRAPIVAGSANNQLAEEDADAARLARRGITYCPDFVVNAGGLINVYTELSGGGEDELDRRLDEIPRTLGLILARARAGGTTTAAAARDLAEERRAVAAGGFQRAA